MGKSFAKLALGVLALGYMVWATPSRADPGRGATVLCYVWANEEEAQLNTPYTPSPEYSFNAQNRANGNTVTRTATGTYLVRCTGVGGGSAWGAGGHVQVSAYGDGVNTACHVGHWETAVADFAATVDCFGRGGGGGGGPAPADSKFVLLFVW
jgi:hypothetical protein